MHRLLLGDVPLGDVAITKESAKRWIGTLTPTAPYYAFRPKIQGNLPHFANTATDPAAFIAAFAQVRVEMQNLALRLEEDSGAAIATSEILISDPFPPDAPEEFFSHALIPVVILLP